MKRLISIILIISIYLIQSVTSFAQYNPNPLNMDKEDYDSIINGYILASVKNLEKLDIVRTPFEKWDCDDYISRRNAFEMVYIIRTFSNRGIGYPIDNGLWVTLKNKLPVDVRESEYDSALCYSLSSEGLFYGKEENGQLLADFDENLTYNEAFTLLYRLILNYHKYTHDIKEQFESREEYPYYRFVEDIGLINSNTIVNYSTLTIDKSHLTEYIPAYEFMHLTNAVLYLQYLRMYGDYGWSICSNRIIDDYAEYYEYHGDSSGYDMYIP